MKVNIGPYNEDESEDFERQIDIHIDDYDVWGLDHTLSLIILPCLKKLKEKKQGSPYIDMEDVPEELRQKDEDSEEYPSIHDRWGWVMNQMIWSFENIINPQDDQFHNWDEDKDRIEFGEADKNGIRKLTVNGTLDKEGLEEYNQKIQNGLNLFGKYFRGLWD